jgi:hypothetical protein
LLEAVFFGYLALLQTKTNAVSSPFYAIMGVHSLYYVIFGTLWMLAYSIGLADLLSFKVYVSIVVVLTVLWFVAAMLLAKTDSDYKETVDELKTRQYSMQYYAQKLNALANRYEKICADKGIVYKTESNNQTILDRLKPKLQFLTPNVFNSETACSQLNALLDQCQNLVDEAEAADTDKIELHQRAMRNFVNNAINEIDLLKTFTRK